MTINEEYKGCRNCKYQPAPLQTCDWLKHQKKFYRVCPMWELKKSRQIMTIDEAKSILIAKANCIDKQCKGIYEDCNENLCDNCVLCYDQGTNGDQIKLLRQCSEWLDELKMYKSLAPKELVSEKTKKR